MAEVEEFHDGDDAWLAVGGEPEEGGGCFKAKVKGEPTQGADGSVVTLVIDPSEAEFDSGAFMENELVKAAKTVELVGDREIKGVPDGSNPLLKVKAALRDSGFPAQG